MRKSGRPDLRGDFAHAAKPGNAPLPTLHRGMPMARTLIDRRRLLSTTMAALSAAIASPAVRAQGGGPRVVVVGGGFGGAACSRALRKADPRIAVTLVEANRT